LGSEHRTAQRHGETLLERCVILIFEQRGGAGDSGVRAERVEATPVVFDA
jgi:hypothetical protein